MTRFIRVSVVLAVLTLVTTLSVPATGSPRSPIPPNFHRLSWSELYNLMPTLKISPSKATGYGQLSFNGFIRHCCGRFEAREVLSYHPPVLPPGASPLVAKKDFCWPWDNSVTNRSCWNDPTTWNWSKILPSPYDWSLTQARQAECLNSAADTGSYATGGGLALGWYFGIKDLVRISPGGWAVGMIMACSVALYNGN